MRRISVVTMLIFLHAFAFGAEPDDTPANRRQAAERYIKANDLQTMLADITDALAKNLPPERRKEMTKLNR